MNQLNAMRQALEAFDKMIGRKPEFVEQAITALRQAIEQAEKQEPIGSVTSSPWRGLENIEWQQQRDIPEGTHMLYLHPPAPAQQPMTDEQVQRLINTKHFDVDYKLARSDEVCLNWYRQGLRDGEAAHGIKGEKT